MSLKKSFISIVVVSFVLLVINCGSSPGKIEIDPELSLNETVQLTVRDVIIVQQFNGIDVLSTWYPKNKMRQVKARIPTGEAEIRFDISAVIRISSHYSVRYKAENIELRYNFEPGKDYVIGMYTENTGGFGGWLMGSKKVGVALWQVKTNSTSTSLPLSSAARKWELGEI